ncbi:MAG: hypothetical protein J6R16_04690 [Alistipes sp.]|nr:hypothetical protein [Alistipes sp.]
MANNKVSSLLNIDLPNPKRSNFNLGRVNRFSADVGWVIPCYVEEILPNSYKRLDVNALIQTNATVAPLMGSFKVKIDAFFVPLRIYHRHLSLNNVNPDFDDNFPFHYYTLPTTTNTQTMSVVPSSGGFGIGIPNSDSPDSLTYKVNQYWLDGDVELYQSIICSPSSLIDYLGMLPVGYSHLNWKGNKLLNGTPFIGYFDIWRNYYSNPHDPNVPFRYHNSYSFDSGSDVITIPTQFSRDVNIPLSSLDDFVNSFTNSVDSGTSLDVIQVFNTFIRPTYPIVGLGRFAFLTSPPLFSGQSVIRPILDTNNYPLYDTRNGLHYGLLRCTYMDDYFNSRFRNDFVAYMEESSRITVQDNSFTINQLRQANRVAKYVDKSIFSDTRFGSWIKAHFGVKTNSKLDIPQFLGSITSNIVFNDIYATAQTGDGDITSNQSLGSRSSLGQGYIKNKGSFVEFRATEPGYLMCMFRIIPYVSYFQGIKKMYLKSNFYDLYRPEFDAIGYDDLQKLEVSAVPWYHSNLRNPDTLPAGGWFNISFDDYNTSLGKHPAWLEYMTSFDESHGLMTQKYQYGYWTLNRPFSPRTYDENFSTDANLGNDEFLDSSTYITPEYYNNIFAVNKYTDNFQVQIRFYDKTKQPISKQILPHL